MAFSSTPKLRLSLLLLFLSMFAVSAAASCSGHGHQSRIAHVSGYFQNILVETFTLFNNSRVTALPDPNSAVKAMYRSARVRLGQYDYFVIGEHYNVTDDSGHRYNGSYTLIGAWNQSMTLSPTMVGPGTGDFSKATGSAYLGGFSRLYNRFSARILLCR